MISGTVTKPHNSKKNFSMTSASQHIHDSLRVNNY